MVRKSVISPSAAPIFAQTDKTWKRIENPAFSFSAPKNFKKSDAHGIDSFVEEYTADGIDLSFDFGRYSNNFGDWPSETAFEEVKIDGKDGRIGTVKHKFSTGLSYSTQVYLKLEGAVALSMFAACKSENEVAIARKIFESISFKETKPKSTE